MSERVANVATILAILLAGVCALLLLQGLYFFAGFALTLIAFAIYIREMNL